MSQNLAINEIPLYRDDLSDSERQQLTASLQQETSDIQKEFQESITNVIESLQRCQVPLDALIRQLERCHDPMATLMHPKTNYVYQR